MPLLGNKNNSAEDQDLNVANNLQQQEVSFDKRLDRIYGKKDSGSERGSSDVVDDLSENGSDIGDYVKNYNSDTDRDNTKKQEESGDDLFDNGLSKGSRFGGKLNGKRLLPGGIIGLLIAGVGAGSVIVIPSSLIVMMERIFTNNGTHDVRANSTMGRARIGGAFSTARDAVCRTKVTCAVASMSSREISRWNSQEGVRIEEGRNAFGKKVITAMHVDIPGGEKLTITNSAEYKKALQDNEQFRRINYTVQHPRAAYFIGPDSKFRAVLKKYKLSMNSAFSKVKPGLSKEERTQIYNADADRATGVPTEGDSASKSKSRVNEIRQKVKATHEKFRSVVSNKAAKALGNAAGWGDAACTLYSVHEATLATIKLNYYSDLIKFFLPFAVLSGQALEGDVDPELMEYAGDRLTWYQKEATAVTEEQKKKINLTATDSQGFQAALYGDYGKLADFTREYAPWWALAAAKTTGMLSQFEELIGGKQNLHTACVGLKYTSYLSSFNPAGLATLAGCYITDVIADDACSDIIMAAFQEVIDVALKEVYERMEETALDSNLKGVDLGNAIGAGIGLFLMEKGRGSGLKPATSVAAVSSYLAATEENYRQDLIAKQEDAMANPFDLTNSYSFTNNVISALTPYKSSETTGFSIATNYLAVLASSFKPLSSTTNAGYFQPIESVNDEKSLRSMTKEGNPDGEGRSCSDEDMNNIGFLCDWTGRSIDVVDPTPLKWAERMEDGDMQPWLDTVEYMEDGEYIEEDGSGTPVDYDQYNKNPDPENYTEKIYKNEYLMYKAYCTNDRVYPLGTTLTAINDDASDKENMGWLIGSKCGGNDVEGNHISAEHDTKLNRFFFYYNICEVQLRCYDEESSTSALGSVTSNTGDWVIPIPGPCSDSFGTRGGAHRGIDIAAVSGTPILAPTSMKITFNGISRDGTTGNAITATATDGSNNSFTFMHMLSKSPLAVGQEVSKGTEIGKVGSTGDSRGPHLHLDVFPPGNNGLSYSGQIDPVPVFAQHGVTISCGG